jgi:hypothetical protein
MELSKPRWREDPSYIDQSIARLRKAAAEEPYAIHARQRERRIEAEAVDGGRAAAATVAPLIGPYLGWDADQVASEVAAYSDRHPLVRA